jgi:hypothetical protein
MADDNTKKFKDIVNSIARKIEFFIKNISTFLAKILDKIVNGFITKPEDARQSEHKYYRWFISILIILILSLFYYLNEKQNLFAIKNTKYEILLALFLVVFSVYSFLFFAYRNNTNWDNISDTDATITRYKNSYNATNRKLINKGTTISPTQDSKDSKESKDSINFDNLKSTLTKPLFNILKYLFYLLLIFLVPLFTINYTLYLHKNSDDVFDISKNIVGILIALIVLAIIAKLFSIKAAPTSPGSIYCELTKQSDSKDSKEETSFTTLLKNYAMFFLCIFKNLIFFIPCLLVILVDEINKDIKLTPSSVYLLFFILLLLVLLIFVLPIIFKYIRTFNKSDILQGTGPFYLNEERTLGKYQNLNTNLSKTTELPNIVQEQTTTTPSNNKYDKMIAAFNFNKEQLNTLTDNSGFMKDSSYNINTDTSLNDTKAYTFALFNDVNSVYNIKGEYHDSVISKERFPYSYTYSLSFYIYINSQPANTSIAYTKDTVLFNYAYKPVIFYNGNSQKIIVKSRTISNRGDQLDTIYEMDKPKLQKWLFFVINYDNNIIDVFIDGKLVGSKENVSPYFKGDKITIGERDGIHGSIKEIYYYDKIKTPSTIELLYNLSKNNKV